IPAVVERLSQMYDASVAALRGALSRYLATGEKPDPRARSEGLFAYPELRVDYSSNKTPAFPARAFGRLNHPGRFATSVARPRLFRKYLIEQLDILARDYDIDVSVGPSLSEIPYPYVLDEAEDLKLDGAQASDLARWFPTTDLAHIGDEIADGSWTHW